MSILARLYASGGSEIIYDTLEVTDGTRTFYLVRGMEDIELGGQVYIGAGIDIALPKRNASGMQDLTFAIDNASGFAGFLIREAIEAGREMTVTLRQFTSDDTSVPATNPITFKVKNGTVTDQVAQITAGYFDMLNTAWPRRLYDLETYRGLTYL